MSEGTERWQRRMLKRVVRTYMVRRHRLTVEGGEHLPPHGPALLLTNHVSYLDFPAIIAIDPYPDSTVLALASLFRVPLLRQALHTLDAIPVRRQGKDMESVSRLIAALREGRVVAVAVDGERTWSGRLERVHPVLAAVAQSTRVPVVPVAIVGSLEAMPRGAMFPRAGKITVRVGPPAVLPRNVKPQEASQIILTSLAALLPEHQRPLETAHSST